VSVTTVVASRTDQARELALRLIGERPGVQQRDLVTPIQEETDLAASTITRLLQSLERDGVLEGRLDGRRKAYALAGQEGAEEPALVRSAPSRGGRSELVAVVTALFVAASLVAFVLAPDKDGSSSSDGLSGAQAAAPAPPPTPARPEPAAKPKPKPKPKRSGALAAARRVQVAVLSGSAVPGIAAKTGAALKRKGFKVGTVGNAPGPAPQSVVLYSRGNKNAARALARSAKIGAVRPVDPAAQAIAPKAGLLAVVGADRRR
jgi:DNA-binding transcriptional ArsR family regulator